MKLLLNSPARNLLGGVTFVLMVGSLAIVGYISQGWSFGDALYMVVLTVFTVGYDEVQPVTAGPLSAITIGLIVTGCTGMIFLTGALVQFITISGIQQVLGIKHMSHQPIAVSYPPHVMGKLACARDAKRSVFRRGAAIRYFDSAPIAFSCASSERI